MKSSPAKITLLACGVALAALPAAFAKPDVSAKFKLLDTDGDGRISRAEHAAGAHLMFQQMDTNGDGVVTAAEMSVKRDSKADSSASESASTRGNGQAAELSAADKIKMIDQDGDGRITAAEHTAGSESMFAKVDANGDGYISESELAAGHAKWMKQ